MKVLVFDFDGLLVDSLQIHYNVKCEIFGQFGVKPTIEEFKKIWISPVHGESGNPYFVKLKGLDASVGELKKQQQELYAKCFANEAKLMPSVLEVISFAKENNVPLVLVSSNYRYNVESALLRFELMDDFGFTVCSEDCSENKPSPIPYLLAAEKAKINPSEMVVLEDSVAGVKSAKAAGCKCIAIPNRFTKGGDFSDADFVVENLLEAKKIIRTL